MNPKDIFDILFNALPTDLKNIIELIKLNSDNIKKMFEDYKINNRNLKFFQEKNYERNGLLSDSNYEIKFNKDLKTLLSTSKVKKYDINSLVIKHKSFDIIIKEDLSYTFSITKLENDVSYITTVSIEDINIVEINKEHIKQSYSGFGEVDSYKLLERTTIFIYDNNKKIKKEDCNGFLENLENNNISKGVINNFIESNLVFKKFIDSKK